SHAFPTRRSSDLVAKGIHRLAEELGVQFLINEEVVSIEYDGDRAKSVLTKNSTFQADIVISGADYAHTETLLDSSLRNYSESYWQKKTFAPSSFLYYVGFNRKVPKLQHHNLFFDTDFEDHAREIYDTGTLPKKPL